jgi:hypothetical protein
LLFLNRAKSLIFFFFFLLSARKILKQMAKLALAEAQEKPKESPVVVSPPKASQPAQPRGPGPSEVRVGI